MRIRLLSVAAFSGLVVCGSAMAACGGPSSSPTARPPGTPLPTERILPTTTPVGGTQPAGGSTPSVQPTPRDDQGPPFQPASSVVKRDRPSGTSQPLLTDVRVGKNAGFDRIVFEFSGSELPGYEVRYVPAVAECGSGRSVSTAGPAQLAVTLRPAAAHDGAGKATFASKEVNAGFDSIKQARATCDFEGVVAWVVGAAEQPFRVIELQNPPRLAVDIRQ